MPTTVYSKDSLNKGQQEACEGFFNFLFNDDKEFIISGPGGYGKTYLMGYLINNVIPTYYDSCKLLNISPKYNEVIMTATTNPAAAILKKSIKQDVQTIYSFMNLKVSENYETGETYLSKSRSWSIHRDKIIFIDEAYRMDQSIINKIHEGTVNCKIVYVGDHCQTSPIKGKCPLINSNITFYELYQPVRNKNNIHLQELCTQLRETVKTGVFNSIKLVPGSVDQLEPELMEQELENNFKDIAFSGRIVAYTNDRAKEYNHFIRDVRHLPREFTEGEYLINNSTIMKTEEHKQYTISTDEEVEIITIYPGIEEISFNYANPDDVIEVINMLIADNLGRHFKVSVPVNMDYFHELIKYYKKIQQWRTYFYLKNNFPDLRQKDSCTIHKVQGATYHTVYIDLADIGQCKNPDTVARLLYVGVSRATERVVFYGNLPSKYGEIIY